MPTQLSLNLPSNDQESYFLIFKKLYYHLYTNSVSSRAERISEDLSKILLCKLAHDKGHSDPLRKYLAGSGTANELLMPMLQEAYPLTVTGTDSFSIGDKAIRGSFELLASLDLAHAPSHIIGDSFQALIGPRLRGDKGQFFTPRSVVKAMVKISSPEIGSKVVDPACGTGGFLTETYNFWSAKSSSEEIFLSGSKLLGIDKDKDLARLAAASLEIIASHMSDVINTNSLDFEALTASKIGSQLLNADVVLTNPPFGARIGVKDREILKQFSLGHMWVYSHSESKWKRTGKLRKSQDPQILFLELCVKLLKCNGVLGIILPEGVFGNKNSGYVWDYLQSQGKVTALIDCPRTTFQPSTDIKTNILFFKKFCEQQLVKNTNEVTIAVALACGHDRRGRTKLPDGSEYPDDFPLIAADFERNDNSKHWSTCKIASRYYWVPRYYDGTTARFLIQEAKKLNADLCSIDDMIKEGYLTVRKGHEVGAHAYGTGNIPFIRTSDIVNWEISIDPTKSVSEEIYKEYALRQNLKEGNILLVVDGRYRIGRTAILHKHNIRSVVQSHLRIISVNDSSPISNYELLFILNAPVMLQQMRNLTFIQSTLGSLGKRIGKLQLLIPEKTDEWLATVEEFKKLIDERAATLAKLQVFRTPEPEL